MQKTILSAATLLSFSFYSYFVRAQDSELVAVVPSAQTTDIAQQNSTNGSAAPPTDFQTYADHINAAAANDETTRSVATYGEEEHEGGDDGEDPSRQTVAQNTSPAPVQQQAVQQTPIQTQPQPAPQHVSVQTQTAQSTGKYKNGNYTGPSVNVFYGYVQVQAIIQGGQLASVRFLQYPSDRSTSRSINSQAMPLLAQEAIQAQSAQVNGVSGASATSQGFIQSLSSALSQAHV